LSPRADFRLGVRHQGGKDGSQIAVIGRLQYIDREKPRFDRPTADRHLAHHFEIDQRGVTVVQPQQCVACAHAADRFMCSAVHEAPQLRVGRRDGRQHTLRRGPNERARIAEATQHPLLHPGVERPENVRNGTYAQERLQRGIADLPLGINQGNAQKRVKQFAQP
jgi:hypothetical protein